MNSAVVGLAGAAFYNPMWTTSVSGPGDFGLRSSLHASDHMRRHRPSLLPSVRPADCLKAIKPPPGGGHGAARWGGLMNGFL
jgi:hypothetical protein